MTKFIALLVMVSFSAGVWAQRDSIAFFYTPQKINILLNERGYDSRLQRFMDYFNVDQELYLVSHEGDVKLACARAEDRATCTFTFYPSAQVQTMNRELSLVKDLSAFEVPAAGAFSMSFLGSMKDNMQLVIDQGVLKIKASKK